MAEMGKENIPELEELKCEVMLSNKHSKLLSCHGFCYGYHACTNRWRCTFRNNQMYKCHCSVTAEERDGVFYITKIDQAHNHAPDAEKLPVSNALNSIKNHALNDLPCQVLQKEISKLPENVAGSLPSKRALTQMIKRERKKQVLDKEPESLEFDIPLRYQQIDDEKFMFGDITVGEDRILIFTTQKSLRKLEEAAFWIMDGTFKVVPKVFFQLYTIHCSIQPHNTVHPMVYILMSGKTTALYEKVFSSLNDNALELGINLAPKLIITDFEKAAINAIRTVFEGVVVKGCHFHFMQNIYKHIQQVGWQIRYGTDIEFALKVRQIAALSFLEHEEIPVWFEEISSEFGKEFEPLTNWLNEYYIGGKNGRPPLFPPSLWSVYEQNEKGIPRTQNYAESYHRRLNTVIGRSHIGVFSLIDELIKNAKNTRAEIDKIERGNPPNAKKNKYVLKEKKIQLILNKKREYSKFGFLKALGSNIYL